MVVQLPPTVAAQVHRMPEAVGEIFLMEYKSGMRCCGKLRRVLVGKGRCPCSLWGGMWDEC